MPVLSKNSIILAFPTATAKSKERAKLHGGLYFPLERRILLIVGHILPVTLDQTIDIETTHIFAEFIQRLAQSLAVN
jgi:hypothetical protein